METRGSRGLVRFADSLEMDTGTLSWAQGPSTPTSPSCQNPQVLWEMLVPLQELLTFDVSGLKGDFNKHHSCSVISVLLARSPRP